MLSIIFKAAIATRITNQLVRTSLDTQLFPGTISTLAFALIVTNAGAITTVKFAPRMEKSVTIVVLAGFLQGNVESRKSRRHNHQNPTYKCEPNRRNCREATQTSQCQDQSLEVSKPTQ